jgi:streptomycin 6-kinase
VPKARADARSAGRHNERVAAFVLPGNLMDSVRSEPADERREWLRTLPEIVQEVAARWSLHLGQPYQPGGRCAWVAPARNRAGQDLVLKVAWRHDEAIHEAHGLRMWAGNGAVRLYDSDTVDTSDVLLLERCHPGTALGEAVPESEQDVVVAALLRRLWVPPTDNWPFRPLLAMCHAWADEFETRLTTATAPLDAGLARAGITLFRDLPASADRHVLLYTDLHAGNILAAHREPWLAIDPKPYVGDPTYDALQHMLNCQERLTADPVGFANRMANLLDLDPDRLLAWLFARCVQESIDDPNLIELVTRLAPA